MPKEEPLGKVSLNIRLIPRSSGWTRMWTWLLNTSDAGQEEKQSASCDQKGDTGKATNRD